mgnify:CR=1 FL=1
MCIAYSEVCDCEEEVVLECYDECGAWCDDDDIDCLDNCMAECAADTEDCEGD